MSKFTWKTARPGDAGKRRCIASSEDSAGVSNYAQLTVARQPVPIRAPGVESAGATYLVMRLNVPRYDDEGTSSILTLSVFFLIIPSCKAQFGCKIYFCCQV